MGYVKKNDVLDILFDCIRIPPEKESDCPMVNYEIAKIRIMQLPEEHNGEKEDVVS